MVKLLRYIGNGNYKLVDSNFQKIIYYDGHGWMGLYELVAKIYQKKKLPIATNMAKMYNDGWRGIDINWKKSIFLAPYLPCIKRILKNQYRFNLDTLCHI